MKIPLSLLAAIRSLASFGLIVSFVCSNALAVTPRGEVKTNAPAVSSVTAKFTTDLTELGREGRLQAAVNFEHETTRLVRALAEGGIRQPVIIDETGSVQSAIVEQLAMRIAKGGVPASLAGKTVLKLEVATLLSNKKSETEATQAVDAIIGDAVASKGRIILFVDELTSFIGSDAVKTKLFDNVAGGKLIMIGGSSAAAYNDKIDAQAELSALFNPIQVTAANNASAADGSKSKNDGFRGDNISPDLREMMAQDPSGQKRVDVIIQAKDADNAALKSLMAGGKAKISERIGSSDTLVVNLPLSALNSLSASGLVNYVSPDRPTTSTGHVEDSTGAALVRAQAAAGGRSAYTLDGTGVGIAVLDSGIYAAHNGFKTSGTSRIVANVNFTTASSTADNYGHGTHVAGLAAGNDSYNGGAYRGVANNANIVSLKVLNDAGSGQTSWLLNGLNWVLTNKATYNIKVVNLSLGANAVDSYTNDPVCVKVKELVNAGIVVVAAAGNLGKTTAGQKVYGRIHSPGNSPYVITVGATNTVQTTTHTDDGVATFSSRGPTRSFFTTSTGNRVMTMSLNPTSSLRATASRPTKLRAMPYQPLILRSTSSIPLERAMPPC